MIQGAKKKCLQLEVKIEYLSFIGSKQINKIALSSF